MSSPATTGTMPISTNAGSRQSPSGYGGLDPDRPGAVLDLGARRPGQLVGEPFDGRHHGRAGAVRPRERPAQRAEGRVGGQVGPDLEGVDPEPQPRHHLGQPGRGRTRQGTGDHSERVVGRLARPQRVGQQPHHVRQVATRQVTGRGGPERARSAR